LAGFCDLVNCLQAPKFAKSEANMPKVSGCQREYSRFAETVGRDRVRSRLPSAGGSQFAIFSTSKAVVSGAVSRVLPPEGGAGRDSGAAARTAKGLIRTMKRTALKIVARGTKEDGSAD
jgi:hypothetical protein